jgi:hypothetical protein
MTPMAGPMTAPEMGAPIPPVLPERVAPMPPSMESVEAQMNDRSLRELVAKLADDGSRLLRQEAELAKREFKEKVDDVQQKVVQATVGGAVLYAGALAVLAGLILLLGLVIPYWLSAIVVGAGSATTGALMLKKAKPESDELKPHQTIGSVRRSAFAMKEAAR